MKNIKTKRVALIRMYYYPSELNIKREVNALLEMGYEVDVVCLKRKGEKLYENQGNVKVYRVPIAHKRGNIIRYLFEFLIFFLFASYILIFNSLKERYFAIQVNSMPDFLVFVALFPKLIFNTKVILHVHEPMPELFITKFGYINWVLFIIRCLRKLSFKYADHLFTVTEHLKMSFVSEGVPENKVTVILNVPDEEIFMKHLRSQRLFANHQVVIFITHGAIEKRYGHEIVLRALHITKTKYKIENFEYWILGEGSYVDTLKRIAMDLGLSKKVKFLGFLSFEDMVHKLQIADVGIVPMERNLYSELVHTNKMYEYILFRKPVILSRLKAVIDYFPEGSVVYFEPGDYSDLAEKIVLLIKNPILRNEIAQNAWELYQQYKWEKMKKVYQKIYKNLES